MSDYRLDPREIAGIPIPGRGMPGSNRFFLYIYTNLVNGKKYIGATNNPNRRFRDHENGASRVRLITKAIKKYGIESFDKNILAIFDTEDAISYHEQAAIERYKTQSPNGYNLKAGAPYTQYPGLHSEESKKLLSESIKKHWRDPTERQRLLESRRQHKISEETRRIKSESMKGRFVSEETREKLAALMIGKKRPEFSIETRENMSKGQKARRAREKKERND